MVALSSSAEAPDLDRIRAVTANFFFWQGLRWVPMGFALIVFAVAPYFKGVIGKPWMSIATFASLAVALWLSSDVFGRYYTKTYGRVEGIPGQHVRRSTIKWFVVYPAVFVAMIVDWKLSTPVFLSGLAFGVG